jgi:hypothetical protein
LICLGEANDEDCQSVQSLLQRGAAVAAITAVLAAAAIAAVLAADPPNLAAPAIDAAKACMCYLQFHVERADLVFKLDGHAIRYMYVVVGVSVCAYVRMCASFFLHVSVFARVC